MSTSKRWIILAAGLAVVAAAAAAPRLLAGRGATDTARPSHAPKALYQCPMHPSVVSDAPGHCPICGMTLRRIENPPPQAPGGKGRILFYRNPMNPDITSPVPAKDSMGMDYVPVYEGEAGAESPVPGRAVVSLPAWRRQLIGVAVTEAAVTTLRASIRTVGRVAYDPELYTALAEYREAVLSREKVKDSPWPDVQEQARALVRASRTKLTLLGLSRAQIDAAAGQGAPTNLLYGRPGGTVWVYAEVYEDDIGVVAPGQRVSVTAPSLPGRSVQGTIAAVDPVLDPDTRTVRVRAEVPDAGGALKPQMFVNVQIEAPLGRALTVPADAIMDTGRRQLAFVEVADGEFEPREVKVGRLAGGSYEVLGGLKAGDKVVTQANFLIDSESRLRAAGAKAAGGKS